MCPQRPAVMEMVAVSLVTGGPGRHLQRGTGLGSLSRVRRLLGNQECWRSGAPSWSSRRDRYCSHPSSSIRCHTCVAIGWSLMLRAGSEEASWSDSVVMKSSHRVSNANLSAAFCTFWRRLMALLLKAWVGTGRYVSTGTTSALMRWSFSLVSKSRKRYRRARADFALATLCPTCDV